MNAFLFVLIGLQLPAILDALDTRMADAARLRGRGQRRRRAHPARLAAHDRVRHTRARPPRDRCARGAESWQARTVVGWAGMRGAVSLAAALALPPDFPQRDLIVFLTFAVIFVTLVLQGLTLPPLIRWLGVRDDGTEEDQRGAEGAAGRDEGRAGADRRAARGGVDAQRHARADARDVRVPQAAPGGARGQGRGRRLRGPLVRLPDARARGAGGAARARSCGYATRARSPTT